MTWSILTVRLTLFPGPGPATNLPVVNELYKKTWGAPPETVQMPPNALAPAMAQGRRGQVVVGCSVHPSRVDFNLQGNSPPLGEPVRLAVIEDPEAAREQIDNVLEFVRREGLSDSVCRTGIYLHIVALTSDFSEANRIVLEAMPAQYRPHLTTEEDFTFQVNPLRPSSAVNDVKMNFLTKWATNRFQVISLPLQTMSAAPGAVPFNFPVTAEFIGGSITFDYNNVPINRSLGREQQISLLREAIAECSKEMKKIDTQFKGF